MDVSHDTDHRAGERLAEIGAPLDGLVKRHLATDRIQAGPEGAGERFVHQHGGAGGEVGRGEFASRTHRDAHRVEITRRNSHEPHPGIVRGVRGPPRDVDGRRQATAREGREIREGDTRHARELPRCVLDLRVQNRQSHRVLGAQRRR